MGLDQRMHGRSVSTAEHRTSLRNLRTQPSRPHHRCPSAVKESIRRIVVEQRLDDDDIVEQVYGSQVFRDGVAAFNGK